MATEILPGSAVRPNAAYVPSGHARETSQVSDQDRKDAADFAESMAVSGADKSLPPSAAKDAAGAGRADDRPLSQRGAASGQGAAAGSEAAAGEAGSRRTSKDAVLTKADVAPTSDGSGRRIAYPAAAGDSAQADDVKADGALRAMPGKHSADADEDQLFSTMQTTRQARGQTAFAAPAGHGQTGATVQDHGATQGVGRQGRGESGHVQASTQALPAAAIASNENAVSQAPQGRRQTLSMPGDTAPSDADRSPEPRHAAATHAATPPQARPAAADVAAAIASRTGDIGADGRQAAVMDGVQVEGGRSDALRGDAARGEIRADAATAQLRHDSLQQRSDTARSVATQMVEAIRPGRDGGVDLALNPQELGRVRLTLQGSETAMHVSITSDRPETQELLRRNIATLEQQFHDLGYGSISFDFGDSRGRSETGQGQAHAPILGDADIAAIVEGPATPAIRGLDLRV